MPAITAVDVHAHHFGTDVPTFPGNAPRLVVDGPEGGRILCGEATFRSVTPTLWDVPLRLAEMDAAGVSHQVISPVPVTMEHAAGDPAYARAMNDSVATACAASGGRLLGLGCLPFTDSLATTRELGRCLSLGLRGVELGTRIGELDLDSPELDEFWAACDESGAAVFVHPVHGGRGAVRRAGQPYDLGLGMPADTAIAASSLVFGGVLGKYERLRVALAHGCGAFPWVYPRLRVAAALGGERADWDARVRRLYADTLVFDDEHLRLLAYRFGEDRLLLGSDAPFFPDQLAKSVDSVRRTFPGQDLLARNAFGFLGLSTEEGALR
ncbi:amidohydrolase [Amycolatopsis acidicola]|uniref:2-amino-3-carboxymuconate-6-semialdehyde decarboxylase n=1 Tax=Amycolatopsis acidicola TaxID=2596893 RepID=A0A5N0VIL0_9PSEU|nr:amidohydrolase family protein [Amycolatopsis acidicola]KAA9164512.1 amidohydrolase [Amycolatopsis acidicola]